MKKLILFLLISISLNSFAQKSFFGVNAGINIANQRERVTTQDFNFWNGSPPEDFISFFKNSIKPTFGIFYQYGFNEKMGIRLNAQFMGLGCKGSLDEFGYVVTPASTIAPNSPNIYYFTLPLTFHYSINKHLSFNAGPYLSFTLSAPKPYGQRLYHKNDNGFSFGGEHDLYKNFAISVSYIWGLKNIWLRDTDNYYNIHTKITNRALQITLIYKFRKSS